ncbi:hypothetical protein ACVW0Y_001207 [Pseudomonas sp. TE3786]
MAVTLNGATGKAGADGLEHDVSESEAKGPVENLKKADFYD